MALKREIVKNCGNCGHWAKMLGDGGHSCSLMTSYNGESRFLNTKAVAIDAESYQAWVKTEKDFYCNQWERKKRRK